MHNHNGPAKVLSLPLPHPAGQPAPPPTPKPATYSVAQAAKILGLSKGATYIGIKDGSIPSIRVGRRILVPRAKLERLLGLAE
ncbi:MAG: helix-turn-helix domain-containing protein [Vulcanimicrobiota bacterium]